MKAKELFPGIFSRHAKAYQTRLEASVTLGHAPAREADLRLAAAQPGERALDLACGPGTLALRLAETIGPSGEVVGIDLAPGMLEVARRAAAERGLKVRFELMDLEALEFEDGS